jgi:hypothetical protein
MARKEQYVWQPMRKLGPGVRKMFYKIPGPDRRIAVCDNGQVDIEMERVESDGDSRTRPQEEIAA